jgi:hypothetical protein
MSALWDGGSRLQSSGSEKLTEAYVVTTGGQSNCCAFHNLVIRDITRPPRDSRSQLCGDSATPACAAAIVRSRGGG